MPVEHSIENVVKAIAAGETLDWSALESNADTASQSLLRDLKIVAQISRIHRARAWGPLMLLERVGGGSFSEVYRAWDARLDREVALKMLRSADALGSSEAVQEAQLLARVRHPSIVCVYGADVVNGEVGMWMEFVRGRTLESCLQDDGCFNWRDAVSIGIAVCGALDAVHRAGLVHCDVKAQNVMREENGRVVLMDFGAGRLAKDVSARLAGTPLYIAPEVIDGSAPTLQSDVYGLGVLLYHLVTNRYPVEGRGIAGVLQAHRCGERAFLRERRPDLPRRFAAVVERALSVDPAARYRTASDFEAALVRTMPGSRRWRWVAVAASAAMVIGAGVGAANLRLRPALALQKNDWILVGPFENRTGDAALDGTIEYALEQELANSSPFALVPRDRIDDALRLMRRPLQTKLDVPTAREVCLRDGGIEALITGRVERIGSRFVITSEVVNPGSGAVVASRNEVASTSGDLLAAVRRNALAVRGALGEKASSLEASRRELEGVTTPSLNALESYSRAAASMRDAGIDGSDVAEQYLRQSLEADPRFASAHVLLAWVLRNQGRPKEDYLAHAEAALRYSSDLTNVERLFIEGSRHHFEALGTADPAVRVREFDLAATRYEMVLREQPTHYWAAVNAERIYQTLERTSELIQVSQKLAHMRPNSFDLNARAALALFARGDAAHAEPFATRASAALSTASSNSGGIQAVDPTYAAFIRLFPAYSAWQRGDVASALNAVERAARELDTLAPSERSRVAARAAEMFATLGKMRSAREISARIPDPVLRDRTRIHLLWLAGDMSELRDALLALRGPKTTFDAVAAMMTEAGMLTQCRDLLDATRTGMLKNGVLNDPGGVRYVAAFETRLAFQEHRYGEAAAVGESLMVGLPPGARPLYEQVTAGNLADAFTQLGQFQRAIATLESFSAYRLEAGIGTGYGWIRLRRKLAEVDHLAGRESEAQAVDAELDHLLTLADPDFRLLRRTRPLLEH